MSMLLLSAYGERGIYFGRGDAILSFAALKPG